MTNKKRGGRPAHVVTKEAKSLVKWLKVAGYTNEQIAAAFDPPIDNKTLTKNYKSELDFGKSHVDGLVTQTLVKGALEGDTALLIFYAKTRLGWKETKAEPAPTNGGGDLASFLLAAIKKK